MIKLNAVLILTAMAIVSPEVRYFRYERPVERTPQTAGQSCLVLDAGIFAHAASGLSDLRLYQDGAETPYAIHIVDQTQTKEQSLVPLNLGRRNGQTVFDVAIPEGTYSDLQLAVTDQNFIATVTVTGRMAPAGTAETKLGVYTIFDLTRQRLGRSTVLHLPESNFKILHFSINGPLSPESINGLSVMSLPASKPKFVTVARSSSVTSRGHSSLIEFTVPAHMPVDRIVFAPSAQPVNFSRDVSITVAHITSPKSINAAEPSFPTTTSGSILRIHAIQDGHRIDEERLTVDAPYVDSNSATKWTVAVDNGDDVPLQFHSVQLQMVERDLCFEAANRVRYTLYYGDSALAAPRYNYASLFTLQTGATQVTAGPERLNPAFQSRPDVRPFTEKHPALLWGMLIAVVLCLGAIALHSTAPGGPTSHNE